MELGIVSRRGGHPVVPHVIRTRKSSKDTKKVYSADIKSETAKRGKARELKMGFEKRIDVYV